MRACLHLILFSAVLLMSGLPLSAESPDFNSDIDFAQVRTVRMVLLNDGTWDVHVTVRHRDEGWDHYARVWQILDDSTGEVLAERILAHPHNTEQPFTRSLNRVTLPAGIRRFRIRSACETHGYGGRELVVDVPDNADRGVFTVIRE